MKYENLHSLELTDDQIWNAVKEGNTSLLKTLPIRLGLNHPNWSFIQEVCIKLSDYPDEDVRGNSFRGLSYTAMTHSKLEKNLVKPVLLRGVKDESEWVSECAREALEEINERMGWRIGSAKNNKIREQNYNEHHKKI